MEARPLGGLPQDTMVRRLALLWLLAVLARLGCPWPLGAVYGSGQAAILFLACAPVFLAAGLRAGAGTASRAMLACTLFVGAACTLDALPYKSTSGVAAPATTIFFCLAALGWLGGWERFGLTANLTQKSTKRALVGSAAVLVGFFTLMAVLALAHVMPKNAIGSPRAPFIETVVFQFIIVAVGEEMVWRGFVQTHLDDVLPGKIRLLGADLGWGALVSALGFALAHMMHLRLGPLGISFDFQPYRLDVLIYVYLRAYGRSIWPSVVWHGLWDGLGNLLKFVIP
jgi:membrane protease YdiL (CAAX protease family)